MNLDTLLAANRALMADLDRQDAAIAERETKARAILDDCTAERRRVQEDRDALLRAEKLYRRKFVPDDDAPATILPASGLPNGASHPKPRARLGPQRYRIFAFLRFHELPESIELIADATDLSIKRVKDQLRSDVAEGFIRANPAGPAGFLGLSENNKYGLTRAGLDLLDRFEAYKRSKGEPLPPVTGPINEDAEGDSEIDHQPEGASAA